MTDQKLNAAEVEFSLIMPRSSVLPRPAIR